MVSELDSGADSVGLMLNYVIFHDAHTSLTSKHKLQLCGLEKIKKRKHLHLSAVDEG